MDTSSASCLGKKSVGICTSSLFFFVGFTICYIEKHFANYYLAIQNLNFVFWIWWQDMMLSPHMNARRPIASIDETGEGLAPVLTYIVK